MKYERQTLAKIIANQLDDSKNTEQLVRDIAILLIKQKQTAQLPSLMRDVLAIRSESGLLEINVVSAFELTEKVQKELSTMVKREHTKAKKVIMNSRIDAAVVGGVRLDLPAEQLNLSVHDRMSRFKQAALKGNI
ncbi:MAG: F0F1 ATP synthase subunit delta [Patescibacteria group bacterium]